MTTSGIARRHFAVALARIALGIIAFCACDRTLAATLPEPSASGPAHAATRILFVGNSYTFRNNLPARLQALAGSGPAPIRFDVDSVTVGSATLLDHVRKTGAAARIAAGGWSYVVIQGQSSEALSSPDEFKEGGRELAAKARAAGAVPVFYETWAHAEGHPIYAHAWSGGSPAAMQAKLDAAYAAIARETNALLVPAGEAWSRALAADPKAPLFVEDGSHPTAGGTYLTACVFYAVLSGRSPVGLGALPDGVSAREGATWQGIAWEAVEASAGKKPPSRPPPESGGGGHEGR